MENKNQNTMTNPFFIKRVIMTFLGILICGVSVGIFKASWLGVDPFQTFAAGLNYMIPINFGTLYMCINIVLLIAMFFVDRHFIGLGTLLNLFFLGYVIDFVKQNLDRIFAGAGFGVHLVMLLIAIPILCLSSALYYTADMGVSTYDVWALVLDKRTRFPFKYIRICTDFICVIVGTLLLHFHIAGVVGVGTIITAFFMGPLIDFFKRTVSEPILGVTGDVPR